MRLGSRHLAALLALALAPALVTVAGEDPPKVTPRLTDRSGSPPTGSEPSLQTPPRLSLERISTAELTGHGGGRALALASPSSRGWGLDVSPWIIEIERELSSIWSMRLDPETEASALDVSYRLVADNGREGALSHVGRPGSEIRVFIEPRLPEYQDGGPEGPVVEGGAVLRLRVEGAQVAGRYSGTLLVTVNHF